MFAELLGIVPLSPALAALSSAVLFWGATRLVLDVSPVYLFSCVSRELVLRFRRAFGLTSRGFDEDAAGPPRAQPADGKKPAPLRGVNVVQAEQYKAAGQTLPPSKRVASLYPSSKLPAGECLDYHFGRPPRESAALGVEENDTWMHKVRCLREGAEVHRQVRQHVQQRVRPGQDLLQICEMVETGTSALVGFDAKNPLRRGWAFPTGLSLNEVAAHDTVNPGDAKRLLRPRDIAKLDFGVQVEGHILDCAFTFTFDPMHDELMAAVQEATNEGIRHAGPDALVSEIGGRIREVMEAGEVHRPNGKVLPVRAIRNLTGHSIGPYKIHAGKSLPSVSTGGRVRMLSGELWAVETFGTVGGVGYVVGMNGCSHFMRPSSAKPNALQRSVLSANAQSLLDIIDRRFGTLAFCPRWIVQEAAQCKSPLLKDPRRLGWSAPLQELCGVGLVASYPPLADLPGSYTAQYEHTILLGSKSKEVLTRGADF